MTYNHACTIAFEVVSNTEDGEDITAAMLFDAIQRRLNLLRANSAYPDEIVEAYEVTE